MADSIKFQMVGLKELQAKLKDLAPRLTKRVVRAALDSGSEVMLVAMKGAVPRDTGFLEQHLNKRIRVFSREDAGAAWVGPEGRMDYPKQGTYIERLIRGQLRKTGRVAVATVARFPEFGTSKMPARPFMVRSFPSVRERVLESVVAKIKEMLEKLKT